MIEVEREWNEDLRQEEKQVASRNVKKGARR